MTTDDILLEQGYGSTDELVKDWSLMVALTKVEQYQAECQQFEAKYQSSFDVFEKKIHSLKNEEDFEQEDDLNNWEFSLSALKWWQNKVQELQDALHH